MIANDPTAYGTRGVRAGKAGTNAATTSGFCARVRRLKKPEATRRLHAGNAASGTAQSSIRSGRVKTQYNTGTARGRVFNRHRRTDLRRGFADDSEAEARAHMAAP